MNCWPNLNRWLLREKLRIIGQKRHIRGRSYTSLDKILFFAGGGLVMNVVSENTLAKINPLSSEKNPGMPEVVNRSEHSILNARAGKAHAQEAL
jgi:hypothetical protein